MKHALCLLVIGGVCILPPPSQAQGWTGNVNALIGTKMLDDDDWEPVEEQDQLGVLVDFRPTAWPVNLAIDLLRSQDDASFGSAVGVDVEITEVDFGVRKHWDRSSLFRPYIGGGLAYVSADLEVSVSLPPFGSDSETFDDSAFGLWVNGGVYWSIRNAFNIGIDLRYSDADVSFAGVDANAGGVHAGLLLGYHW